MISVVTINLNNCEGLRKTIESVVNQSYFRNIEYIVVDGGSTDGSVDIIRENERHIKHWVSEKDNGVYNAMNKGLHMANGDYTIFLNSGDWFYSTEIVSWMIPFLDKDIVFGDLLIHGKDGWRITKRYTDKITPDYFTYEAMPHEASFVKTSLYKSIGFREDYKILSDSIFFHEAINVRKVSHRHVCFTVTHFYLGGISSDEKLLREERMRYFGKAI